VQSDAVIGNSTFQDNHDEAIRLHRCDHRIGPCHPSIVGNQFAGNASPILRAGPLDAILSGNTASNNALNGFVIGSPAQFVGENRWYAGELTYVVPQWVDVGGYGPASLTIEAGTVIKFGSGSGLTIKDACTLTAAGTAEELVVFTSIRDDSVGGDTNNDGSATAPASNDWSHVLVTGAGTRASLDHCAFRYGGAGGLGSGKLLWGDYGARLVLRHSDLAHSDMGLSLWRDANAEVTGNSFRDCEAAGIESYSDGEILIADNRFEGNAVGVLVSRGHPVIRDNYFQGNATAVEATCRPVQGSDCAPVVSPHNRFVGKDQRAVIVRYPAHLCVQAQDNWWGDKSGPLDSSSGPCACELADNDGSGGQVSDGVNYDPWAGGIARPVIASPLCGLTARTRPTFKGRRLAGATITFYDGEAVLGQTAAMAGNTFSWMPSQALSDRLHVITAKATFGGHTSLASEELWLTVDSSLVYDPASVLVTYDYHGRLYTQSMRDTTGCPGGPVPDAPLYVQPGTTMTVSLQVRASALEAHSQSPTASDASRPVLVKPPPLDDAAIAQTRVVTITNYGNTPIIGYKPAAPDGHPNNRVYGAYGRITRFPTALAPGKTMTITVTGPQDLAFVDPNQYLVHRAEVNTETTASQFVGIPDAKHTAVRFDNLSGAKIVQLYLAQADGVTFTDRIGGSMLPAGAPLAAGDGKTMHLPNGVYDVIAVDESGGYHLHRIQVDADVSPACTVGIARADCDLQIDVGLYNAQHLYLLEQGSPATTRAVNLLQLVYKQSPEPMISRKVTLRLEAGLYDALLQDDFRDDIGQYLGLPLTDPKSAFLWEPHNPCTLASVVREAIKAKIRCGGLWPFALEEFVDCYAAFPAGPGPIAIETCVKNKRTRSPDRPVVIDPDGYVYDAAVGLSAKIAGATVTCNMFDEDLQAWERWPAELYYEQINPQITEEDGYYAFFVPPGLYQVLAAANGYLIHRSPEIRVINEIIHYNVPMERGGAYLPLIARR